MSASQPSTRRGKPVVALAGVLAAWVVLRVVFWQSPLILTVQSEEKLVAGEAQLPADPVPRAPEIPGAQSRDALPKDTAPDWQMRPVDRGIERPIETRLQDLSAQTRAQDGYKSAANLPAPAAAAVSERHSSRRAIGHTLLLAAGLSHMEIPSALAQYLPGRGPVDTNAGEPTQSGRGTALAQAEERPLFASALAPPEGQTASSRRWSADMWAYWRDNAGASSTANGNASSIGPSYGRSQIGAVMRYELAPRAAQRPQAYLRASAALEGSREREMAAGLSARPLASVPLRLAAEARVSERASGSELRAAAYAVTEIAPIALPGGASAEIYAQAGYVTGDVATGFVDGQARITRRLVGADTYTLAAGGGVWGGAQEGASRLDIGPTASVTFRLGEEGFGRLSADYRFRVAGDAAPSSGPALTLSAGF